MVTSLLHPLSSSSDRLWLNDGEQRLKAGACKSLLFLLFALLDLEQSSFQTLQQAQTNALLTLLNLNEPIDLSVSAKDSSSSTGKTTTLNVPAPSGPTVWKVLVLDQFTKDVIATVLRVQDLRDVGVTLHVYVLPLQPIPSLG